MTIGRRALVGAVAIGLTALGGITRAHGTTQVTASSFGFDPLDGTASIQAALDSTADLVIIDNVGQDWVTRPLFVRRDNVTVLIEPGVTLRAKPGGYPLKRDSILLIDGRTNVQVIGYGATLRMNKPEYTGEWKCCVRVHGSSNITLEGLTLRDADGDGLLIGKSLTDTSLPPWSTNVTVRNVVCDGNKRNGMSVITVDGLLVEGCAFNNTSGTAPQAGVDFEPDLPEARLRDIVVRDSVAIGNEKLGWITNATALNGSSDPISLTFERIYAGPVPSVSFSSQSGTTGDPGGTVNVSDSLIDARAVAASTWVSHAVPHTGLHTEFTDVTWWMNDNPTRTAPLLMLSSGVRTVLPRYGNAGWNRAQIHSDNAAKLISVEEGVGTLGLSDVHGTFDVVSPQPITTNLGVDPVDVDIDITQHPAPSVVVCGHAAARVSRGGTATVTLRRVTSDVSRPLAIAYHLEGSAAERFDFDGTGRVAVIPTGSKTVEVPLRTRAGVTASINPVINFVIDAGPSYAVSATPVTPIEITP